METEKCTGKKETHSLRNANSIETPVAVEEMRNKRIRDDFLKSICFFWDATHTPAEMSKRVRREGNLISKVVAYKKQSIFSFLVVTLRKVLGN